MGEVKEPGNPPGCCRHRSSAAAALTAAPPGSPARRRTGAGAGRPPGPRRPPARSCPGRRREGHPQPLAGENCPLLSARRRRSGRGRAGAVSVPPPPSGVEPGRGAAARLSLTLGGLPGYRGAGIPAGPGAPGPRLPVQHP